MIPHNIARKLGALLLRHDELPAEVASGTVTRVDEDGVVWVQLYGAEDETPCETATVDVHEGDEVTVTIDGGSASIGGNVSRPATDDEVAQEARSLASSAATIAQAVSDELPKVRAVAVRVAEVAQGIAQEAQAIAEATNQHFFADGNGVHVTEVENDPTTEHNILINSLGILLRKATLPLVAISQSAIAFYDGVGNAASNIVARFGADGSQIGKSDESHVELDYHSLQMKDNNGYTYFHVSDLRDRNGEFVVTDIFDNVRYQEREEYSGFWVALSHIPNRDHEAPWCTLEVDYYTVADFQVFEDAGTSASLWVSIEPETIEYEDVETGQSYTEEEVPEEINITFHYWTKDSNLKAFTFGSRNANASMGTMSSAIGEKLVASGDASHAEGSETKASGGVSHAEGYGTESSAFTAHSEGCETIASGMCSHAQNRGTIAATPNQTAIGSYNVKDSNGDYALIIGNGTSSNRRSNALTVDWAGGVEAVCLTLRGYIRASSATITGTVSAASATLTGALSAASATLTGALSAASATISGLLAADRVKIAAGGAKGLLTEDSTGYTYPLISDNGNNLWIGAHKAGEQHHTGGTFISAGAGRDSIYVSVPNSDNTGATNYPVLHTGYPVTTTTTISDVISAQTGATVSSASFSQWGKFCMLSVTYTLSSEISVPANGNTANTALFTIAAGKRPVEYLDVMLDVNVGAWGHITTGGVVSLDGANSRGAAWTLDTTTARYLRCCYLLP